MKQQIMFYFSLVITKDEESGDYVASFAQFPEAAAQGRTEEEAVQLLSEIMPLAMAEKKQEFLNMHQGVHTKIIERQMVSA